MKARDRRVVRRAAPLTVLLIVSLAPAIEGQDDAAPEVRASAVTMHDAVTSEDVFEDVDIGARFEQFQREFARDFGFQPPAAVGVSTRPKQRKTGIETRWEGSAAYRWYERLSGVYERVEGLYDRIEMSTRWASSGFEVDPSVERVFDGKLGLQIERRVAGFDMGFNVDDAVDGRLGFRVGGIVRGYKVSFDVSDIVEAGRFGFQLRRMTR